MTTFFKDSSHFPIKKNYIFLSHCGISPLYAGAYRQLEDIARKQMETANMVFHQYDEILDNLRSSAANLLKTSPSNISFIRNTSEGVNMIANGYPFQKDDQIITYTHEYPANYYPWVLQENRQVKVTLLDNHDITGLLDVGYPSGWSMDELKDKVSDATKVIAISHVQFTSGFAADLQPLAQFCNDNDIDLVVDATQSLGALPIYPDELGLAAVICSGWKWLLGPTGSGLLYTSEKFRKKLENVVVGAGLMKQGTDYLDHTWDPHTTGKRFEYSTSPITLAAALNASISDLFLKNSMESIRDEIYRLQELFLKEIDHKKFTPVIFPKRHRSGILSLKCSVDPVGLEKQLPGKGVICTSRGGFLRFAPHFYISDEEVKKAASILNSMIL